MTGGTDGPESEKHNERERLVNLASRGFAGVIDAVDTLEDPADQLRLAADLLDERRQVHNVRLELMLKQLALALITVAQVRVEDT